MAEEMLKTALADWHAQHGGKMVDFAGWWMPVQYQGIVAEHQAVRTAVGLFDVSHMGRLRFTHTAAAEALLEKLATRKIQGMPLGKIRYSLLTREDGGILDDVLIYRLRETDGQEKFWMVVNASNRAKIVAWLRQHDPENQSGLQDLTLETAMIAVQGPAAVGLVDEMLDLEVAQMGYYTGRMVTYHGYPLLVSRTGYTGEDGVELIPPASHAEVLWQTLVDRGETVGVVPAGLGARDTLRLEAGMPLYGHELSESINPAEAGLDFAINLADRDFVGRDAIAAAKQQGLKQVRVGLELEGRRPAREDCPVLVDQQVVGRVTSGTFAPTLQKPIAMAHLPPARAALGTRVQVDIRGKQHAATIVKVPFYSRS